MSRSVAFWSEVVGLPAQYANEDFCFLDGGDVQLILNSADGVPQDDTMTEIVFEVDDVAGAYEELAGRGVPFEVEPRVVTSDGDRDLVASHFRDPDGHAASITGWVDHN